MDLFIVIVLRGLSPDFRLCSSGQKKQKKKQDLFCLLCQSQGAKKEKHFLNVTKRFLRSEESKRCEGSTFPYWFSKSSGQFVDKVKGTYRLNSMGPLGHNDIE